MYCVVDEIHSHSFDLTVLEQWLLFACNTQIPWTAYTAQSRMWGVLLQPSPAFHNNFIVLDINGVHEVALDFCACELAQSHAIQLLRTWWYPSMTTAPQSTATF
jgi:hypothetical protein